MSAVTRELERVLAIARDQAHRMNRIHLIAATAAREAVDAGMPIDYRKGTADLAEAVLDEFAGEPGTSAEVLTLIRARDLARTVSEEFGAECWNAESAGAGRVAELLDTLIDEIVTSSKI